MPSSVPNQEGSQELLDIDRFIHEPARLMILTYLYTIESADFVFLMRLTGLTWGNLSSHLSKVEQAGYVEIEKQFANKKPHTMIRLTQQGRVALRAYRQTMQRVLNALPDE
ncbi:MAG: transcriptional regulator [Chloroflexi bacterium]|nr:transcriptional regulator [Chloroflexota bacterium]